MTTLLAYAQPFEMPILIGSDQMLGAGDQIERLDFPKWRVAPDGSWAVGASGSPSIADLGARILAATPDMEAQFFAEELRGSLLQVGWVPDARDGNTPSLQCAVMAVLGGKLYEIEAEIAWALEVPDETIVYCGSGGVLARGAWLGMDSWMDPSDRAEQMRRSLEIAIHCDKHSGGKPWVRELKR